MTQEVVITTVQIEQLLKYVTQLAGVFDHPLHSSRALIRQEVFDSMSGRKDQGLMSSIVDILNAHNGEMKGYRLSASGLGIVFSGDISAETTISWYISLDETIVITVKKKSDERSSSKWIEITLGGQTGPSSTMTSHDGEAHTAAFKAAEAIVDTEDAVKILREIVYDEAHRMRMLFDRPRR